MQLTTVWAASAIAALTACGSDMVGPQTGPLRLEASVARATLQAGDTTRVTFRLRNVSTGAVALSFPTACQILPYITTPTNQMVYPGGGAWGCLDVVTSFTLAPGATRELSVLVRAAAEPSAPAVSLVPGTYVAFARLENAQFRLRSPSLSLRVE